MHPVFPKQRAAAPLFLAITALVPAAASAQGSESASLDAISVEAARPSLMFELEEHGHAVEVISRADLDRANVDDLGQALQMFAPGLYVAPRSGRADYVNVSLQGSRAKDILWLVDGVRVNNRLYGSTTPLDTLSTHMVKRIEVIKGAESLFYGTQAVAGVVNVITRDPRSRASGQVSASAGTLKEGALSAWGAGGSENHQVLAFARRDGSKGFQPFPDGAYEPNARKDDRGYDRLTAGLKSRHDLGAAGNVQLFLQRNEADLDYARPYNQHHASNDRTEHLAYVNWDRQWGRRFALEAQAYWHEWWTDFTRVGLDGSGNKQTLYKDEEWGFEEYGARATARFFQADGSTWVLGADYHEYYGEDYVLRIDQEREAVAAVYGQYRPHLSFAPRTDLALGVRYHDAEKGGEKTVWNLSGRRPLPGGTHFRASTGTAFRLPTAYEQFVDDPCCAAGNPDLDAEESFSVNGGFGGSHRLGGGNSLTWEASGFYRRIKDLVQVEGDTFVNADNRVISKGAEGKLGLRLGRRWRGQVAATYTEATERGSSEQIDEIPRSFLKALLGYDTPGGVTGGQLTALYVGKVANTVAGSRETYGRYWVFDLSAYRHLDAARRHRLGLRLENLLDRRYASQLGSGVRAASGDDYAYRYLGTPRNLQATYTYSF
ncbi:TonB-dependent receptor plug domain-containing protein [Thiohalorhabdus sp. Cl-TMA]|uniref:TonB-dependent receptor plug domain-containing protein n=1 Tax=Thiohalorhabdus methylotrophus TaxID=3242694 RepID=A0ABV4TV61_9GAMM